MRLTAASRPCVPRGADPWVEPGSIARPGRVAGGEDPEFGVRSDDLPTVLGDDEGMALDHVVESGQFGRVHEVDLVEEQEVALAQRHGQGAVDEAGRALDQHELPDQVGELHAPVTGHGLHRPVEPVGDLADERGIAAAGRACEQECVARGIAQEGDDPREPLAEHIGRRRGDVRMIGIREAFDAEPLGGLCSLSIERRDDRPRTGSGALPGRG